MSEKKVHQPLPLDSLFVFLEAHGFRTDPARRFRLLRVLYSRGWSELGEDGFQTLKYRLAPFVITSADEQERFYALFDQWLAEAEQEAAPMQDDEVEQPVAPGDSQSRRLFLPAMLGMMIVMAFLAVYFFGSPQLPRIRERTANLVEGTPVSFSTSLDWRQSPKHLGWRLIGASTDTLLAGQPAFSFVTPIGAGDTLQLVLMYRGAVTDSLSLPVFCATPPKIKGLSLPDAIVANQEFSLGVSLDSGLMAQWVLGAGDTTLFGARVTYTPATSDNLSVQLRVYQPDGYDCCFSETRQLLRAKTAEKPYMAKAPLQRDAPLLSRSLHGLFWLLPLILLGLALAGLQHRQKKRRAYRIGASAEEEVEFEIKDNAPYFIPYLPHDDLIQVPREFYQMVEVLRRREMGTTRNFDLGASLQATLESGGYPAFKEKWNTRPGSWLFLIERKTPREQLGRLFGRLAGFLTAENAPVDIYVHDGSFNNFLPYGGAPSAKPLNLYELYQRYPLHRLVALGSGRGMINTYQGLIFPGIRKGLERWDKRLLLTPLPISDWSGEESLLHDLFVMYPADTAGCLAGFEQMDSQEDDYEPGDFKVWRGLLFRERSDERLTDLYFEDPADYRFYLGYNKDLYRWLCGLSVCVAPDWSLTLAIGHALGVEITHDNLLKLARIPWLNENAPDTGMRLKLLSQLSEKDVQKARGALLEELEAVKDAVKGGFAEVEQRSQYMVQQFALDPRDSGHRKHLRALMRAGWISGGQKVELEEVVWKNADKKGLKGVARDSLQGYLDTPEELPLMGERLIAPILLAVLAVVLVFHGLWDWPAWPKAPWWVTQEEMDEAFVVHKEALDLADSLDLADAGSIDTLFGRAVQLRRPDYYAAADANRQAFRFNQGVRALHAILDQNTLVNGLDSQALVWFGQAETGPDPQLSLAALHGLGLTYFYQSDTSLARRVYQELMAATGQTYFDSLSLTQPVHLAYLLGDPFQEVENMVLIKGGSFTMGCTAEQGEECNEDERPAYRKDVADFYLGRYEVTHADWYGVMKSRPSTFDDCDQCPVESVSWDDVQAFIEKLNGMTGKTYRLPTEAEWEYAARGGSLSKGYKYAGSNDLREVGWHEANGRFRPEKVGMLKANELGLYDMSGNVSEWVSDVYGPYLKPVSNDTYRGHRGGAWDASAEDCRVAYRDRSGSSQNSYSLGFRLAMSATTPEADVWAAALRLNSVQGFWSYLEKYPSGQYVAEARSRLLGLEDAYWREVKDRDRITGYEQYVRYYANGKYVAEARARITDWTIILKIESNMVAISGGTFMMGCTAEQGDDCFGDELPVHEVTLSSYYLGKYEVTQAEWRAVMGADPEELGFPGCDQCPVESVSWDDVQEFIRKLNSLTGKRYRLPTEAEWEYAARGGKNARGYKYAGSNNVDEVGWYDGNSGNKTHPVGQKRSNELGLYDMSGNVWEWCSDWYGDYNESSETKPRGASTGSFRVGRGGSWFYNPQGCRVSRRSGLFPDNRFNDIGFRLALVP